MEIVMLALIIKFWNYSFVFACMFFLVAYLPRVACWFSAIRKQKRYISTKNNKLALLVPARNESAVIGELFDSIDEQTYPKEFFDVYVLIKDPNDKTVKLAQKRKNTYIEVIPNQTCKGDTLDFSMKKIIKKTPNKYDAFIIVDADCVLEKDFLKEMNNAMASDKQIILSKKLVKNYLYNNKSATSLASNCNGMIWTIIDDMGNRFKSDHNMTIMTIGTGLLIRADVVRELGGWPYCQTLTEDIELMYDCVLRDYTTLYYSYAKLYLEESTSLSVTNKRRTRWLTGVIDSKKLYSQRLRRKCKTKHQIINLYYTTALIPVFFFIGFMLATFLISAPLSALLFLLGNPLYKATLMLLFSSFATTYISFWFLTLFCLIVDFKNHKMTIPERIAVLFVHPLFYMGYIKIGVDAYLSSANREWEVIDRMEFNNTIEETEVKEGYQI